MRRRLATFLVALLLGTLTAVLPAAANILPGQTAPNFTKAELDASPPASRSLSDYAGKVVVLFLFGHNCGVCRGQAPAFQQAIWQSYQTSHPGQVQVLGVDVWNGTVANVREFRDVTGATFPLLLQGAAVAGGDLSTLYGPWDNYIVINKQGIVRYHAANIYPHGNRYQPNELRATIDSLVSATVDVPGPGALAGIGLSAGPNPFRSATSLRLSLPASAPDARIDVLDVHGRRVARLHSGALAAGEQQFQWNGRDASGGNAAPGIYLVRATLGDRTLERRLVRLP